MEAITLAQTSHGTASTRDVTVGVLMLDVAVTVLIYAPLQRKSCAVKKWIQDTLNGHSFVVSLIGSKFRLRISAHDFNHGGECLKVQLCLA